MASNKAEDCRRVQISEGRIEIAVDAEDVSMGQHQPRCDTDAESRALAAMQDRSGGSIDIGCFNISSSTGAGTVRISYGIYSSKYYLVKGVLFYLIF